MGCVCGTGARVLQDGAVIPSNRSPVTTPLSVGVLAKQSNSSDATARPPSKPPDPKAVILVYFDALGDAEVIRILLKFLNVDYEDKRVTGEEWEKAREIAEFGNCPVLMIDERRLVQTKAILRYVAQKHGLYPALKDLQSIYSLESACDFVDEVKKPLLTLMEKGEKEQLREQYVRSEEQLRMLSQRLVQNKGGRGWFIGSQISLIDICVVQLLWDFFLRPGLKEQHEGQVPDPLKAYMRMFLSLYSHVSGYLATRPASAY